MRQRCPVRRVLLSVSDKAGIVEFAQVLSARGVELLSTGGTARLLAEKGLPVTEVSDYTGFPGMMGGRVKTLHPRVHGDILGRHGLDDAIVEEHQTLPIGMVVVNLYPLAQTIARGGCSLEDAVGNIDIGGPAMARSAARNYKDVAIVVKSSDYDAIIKETDTNEGSLTLATRSDLAIKTFEHTAAYDSMIINYFGSMAPVCHDESKEAAGRFPCMLNLNFIKKQDVHYNENSRQQAAFYIEEDVKEASVAITTQVRGKVPSYNNIADTDAALECAKKLAEPVCVIVKHANPYGVATGHSVLDTYDRAYKTDPTSTFGDIIAFNRELDAETAQVIISHQLVKVIITPSTSKETLKITATKQNVRVLTYGQWGERVPGLDFERVNSGLLVQDRDLSMIGAGELRVVTKRQPDEQGLRDALSCWKVVKFVKSNATVYVKNSMTIDIGAGQISHVYSIKIAGVKAADEGLEMRGPLMASDAFFPFRDGIDTTATAGVTYVIQPGGPIRDDKVVATAGEHGIAVLFTDMRHLRH